MTIFFNALHPRVDDGTFTNKTQSVSPVALSADNPIDQRLRIGADALIAKKLKTAAANELGGIQRQYDKQNRYEEAPKISPLGERVAGWESLDKEGQRKLFKDAGLEGHAYLLDDLEFVTDRVHMPDDLLDELSDDDLVIVQQANRLIEEAELPGDITLTEVYGGDAEYIIDHGGVAMQMRLGARSTTFRAHLPEDEYDDSGWMDRVDGLSAGEKFGYQHAARGVATDFKDMHSFALLCQEMKLSVFGNSNDLFGILDIDERTAELKVDGSEYEVNIRDSSVSVGGDKVHKSMADGLLEHVSAKSIGTDGKTFVTELADVMRIARERIAVADAQ